MWTVLDARFNITSLTKYLTLLLLKSSFYSPNSVTNANTFQYIYCKTLFPNILKGSGEPKLICVVAEEDKWDPVQALNANCEAFCFVCYKIFLCHWSILIQRGPEKM